MKTTIFLLCFVILFFSCKDDKNSNMGRNYEIPRFAVYPLSDSGIFDGVSLVENILSPEPNSKLKYFVLAPVNIFFPMAHAQSAIDCTDEVNLNNEAPQTFGRAASISPEDLLKRFYAQTIFYDCVIREQAQSFGIGETVQVAPKVEGEDPEEIVVLTAENIGSDPEKRTEYVSWTDLPESENVRGRLVNKYVQDDGIITKTRVDLNIVNRARTVTSLLHFVNQDGAKFYSKANFQESNPDADGNFQQHEVWGRLYDTTNNMVVQARAIIVAGGGFSAELKKCPISSSIETSCNGATPDAIHLDGEGNTVGERSFGSNQATSFYGSQSESEYFTPEFNIEQ